MNKLMNEQINEEHDITKLHFRNAVVRLVCLALRETNRSRCQDHVGSSSKRGELPALFLKKCKCTLDAFIVLQARGDVIDRWLGLDECVPSDHRLLRQCMERGPRLDKLVRHSQTCRRCQLWVMTQTISNNQTRFAGWKGYNMLQLSP